MRYLILALTLGVFAMPAWGHGEWAWVQKYNNGHGMNCCDQTDAVVIPQSTAASAVVGTVIVAPFPTGIEPVAVKRIFQTEDPEGKAWLTRYGCLFRSNGM